MKEKQTVWIVIFGAGALVGYRALREGNDPIPQLAGIGTAGVILLMLAGPAPKLASGMAVLMGISFVFGYTDTERIRGGGRRTNPSNDVPAVGGGGSGGTQK